MFDDTVQQITRSSTVEGADGKWLAHAQTDEVPHRVLLSSVVNLVGDQHCRCSSLQHPSGGELVLVGESHAGVYDQQNERCFIQSGVGLLGDLVFEFIAGLQPTTGVGNVKGDSVPFDFEGLTVAGYATVLLDNGHTTAGETIYE